MKIRNKMSGMCHVPLSSSYFCLHKTALSKKLEAATNNRPQQHKREIALHLYVFRATAAILNNLHPPSTIRSSLIMKIPGEMG